MKQSQIIVRVDADLKNDAAKMFNEMGFNMSTAINMFLKQSLRERSLPFKPTLDADSQFSEEDQNEPLTQYEFNSIKSLDELMNKLANDDKKII